MGQDNKWALESNEYHPYYKRYTQLLKDQPVIDILENQIPTFERFMDSLTEEKSLFRYAAGKWSVKEVIAHITDTERVFAYRALVFARNDQAKLPGFEQDDYIRDAQIDQRTSKNLREEFIYTRKSNIALFSSLNSEELIRKGFANDSLFTVRSIVYVIAGHFAHHLKILQEKYL